MENEWIFPNETMHDSDPIPLTSNVLQVKDTITHKFPITINDWIAPFRFIIRIWALFTVQITTEYNHLKQLIQVEVTVHTAKQTN